MISRFPGFKAAAMLSMMMFITSGEILAQDTGSVLRSVVTRIPELTLVNARQGAFPYQNSWTAFYRTPKFQPFKEVLGDVQVRLDVYDDIKAANWRVEQSLHGTSVGPDRKDMVDGKVVYVWNRFGSRLLYQAGMYVVNVESQRDEQLAMRLLESVVRALESARPKPQMIRVRDVPDPDGWTLSWGPQAAFFKEQNFLVLPWEDALQILLDRELQGGKQYHTGWLTIFCVNGDSFLTKQPEIDTFFKFAEARSISLKGFSSE